MNLLRILGLFKEKHKTTTHDDYFGPNTLPYKLMKDAYSSDNSICWHQMPACSDCKKLFKEFLPAEVEE